MMYPEYCLLPAERIDRDPLSLFAGSGILDDMVVNIGHILNKRPFLARTDGRVLQHHGVILVEKGAGYFEDFQTDRVSVSPGTVLYLFPNRRHNYDPEPGTTWDERWLLFSETGTTGLFAGLLPENGSVNRVPSVRSGAGLHEELLTTWRHRGKHFTAHCSFLLHRYLYELFCQGTGSSKTFLNRKNESVVFAAQAEMNTAIGEASFNVHEFARKKMIGYERFRKLFKDECGYSPQHYFHALKLNAAREMLINSQRRIKEITFALGFTDSYYFSRWFKAREGCSPREYRNRYLHARNDSPKSRRRGPGVV